MAVSGDTLGSIGVGRVFRVQAFGVTNSNGQVAGGTIASTITAHMPNDNDDIGAPLGQMSVNVVTAGKGITGSIVAIGGTDAVTGLVTHPAGIGRVIVGPVESTVGISGDIRAETGRISAIYTTGPIGNGSTTARTKIWAADGITEIRAISEANASSNNQTLALAKDIDADIQANRNYVPNNAADPSRQGCIRFVQTGGNLKGSVKAGNLAVIGHNTGDPHFGILVGGEISAPITIDLRVREMDIIAAQITGPIVVGVQFQGAIVAAGSATSGPGHIESVTIGYDTSEKSAVYRAALTAGFVGSKAGPIQANVVTPVDVYTIDDWFSTSNVTIGASVDCVIRAAAIGSLNLRSMTRRVELSPSLVEPLAPRVEAFEIGSLTIGDMREGVVWSGRVQYDSAGNIPNADQTPPNPWASITGSANVDCVGPFAALWVDHLNEVAGEMRGLIELPHSLAGSKLKIGHRLGTTEDECMCETFSDGCGSFVPFNPAIGRPTPHIRDQSFREFGRIGIAEPQGLQGQIIINANRIFVPAAELWKGEVVIGDAGSGQTANDPATAIRVAPGQSQPDMSPYYNDLPADLGGSAFANAGRAIGLAPFHLHEAGCIPPHNLICKIDGVPEADFDNTAATPVIIEHYGPITKLPTNASWKSCVMIEAQPLRHCPTDAVLPGPAELCNWIDVTTMFNVKGPGDAGWARPNAIGLSRISGKYPKPGIYRVKLVMGSTGLPKIRCAEVTGTPAVAWPYSCAIEDTDENGQRYVSEISFAYVFKIATDCDHDHHNDEVVTPDTDRCHLLVGCRVDVNHTDGVSVQDIFDFLGAWFNLCLDPSAPECNGISADWNLDGIVNVQDIFDYLGAWFASGGLGCT